MVFTTLLCCQEIGPFSQPRPKVAGARARGHSGRARGQLSGGSFGAMSSAILKLQLRLG